MDEETTTAGRAWIMPERPGQSDGEKPLDEQDTPRSDAVGETRRVDPDAPALGAVDGAEEVEELPEPQEPG
jgi:hypothetical protein